jgi:hypothetical protein
VRAIDIPVGHIAKSKEGSIIVLNCVRYKDQRISVYLDDGSFEAVPTNMLFDEYEDMGRLYDWICKR